jgi:phosphoglycerate kinase
MNKKTIDDIALAGKRVLLRVDFNVPLDGGRVADDTRLSASLPTIRKLSESGARTVLVSHLGRPKGQTKPEFSLRPVAVRLGELLGRMVPFGEDCIGDRAAVVVNALRDGDTCLLENLRFHSEEEKNDAEFSRQLATWGNVFVNDAFGSAHRAHASTEGVTRFIKIAVAGYLMEKELNYLGSLLVSPKRPFTALLGGAKVSGKLEVITNLMRTVDTFLIGGGMAFTFLKAQGKEVGKSLVEPDLVGTAGQILTDAARLNKKFLLPCDFVAAKDLKDPGRPVIVDGDKLSAELAGYDIGPRTAKQYVTELKSAGTIFWNGPMGVFESEPFESGTIVVSHAVADATDKGAVSVVGGGDSVAAVHKANVASRISHISTGGGASLEFIEGKTLPGVAALNDR